jgi:hypothetical protein
MHARRAAVFSLLLALPIVTLVPRAPSSWPFFRSPPRLNDGDKVRADDDAGGCDYSDGVWVRAADSPAVYGEDCPFLDPGFQCARNGRRNSSFRHWRWQPRRCNLPK